jgi:TetR/AcrR family transcriptional regulator
LLDTLRSRIEVAQRRGRIREDLDPSTLSLMIFGLVFFWVENRAHFTQRFQGTIDDESFLRQAIALVERGVGRGVKEKVVARA